MTFERFRFLKYIGLVACLSMLVGMVIRLIGFPNQLIFYLTGLSLFIVVFIPMKASTLFGELNGWSGRLPRLGLGISGAMTLLIAPMLIMNPSLVIIVIFGLSFAVLLSGFLRLPDDKFARKRTLIIYVFLIIAVPLSMLNAPIKSQAPDKFYEPGIKNSTHPIGLGPKVFLDEGHENFHTLDGLYWAFGEVLRRDGYRTQAFKTTFTQESLRNADILVIANAISVRNKRDWSKPIYPAFTEQEIEELANWVRNGGSLFLIADHMPFPGAAKSLASKLGVRFIDGFAMDTLSGKDIFTRSNGTLRSNSITNGFEEGESVDSIMTFTGQAFLLPDSAQSILTFSPKYVQWEPEQAWSFKGVEPYSVEGYSQGGYFKYGAGRVAVFGEAMMFTSQLGWGFSWKNLGLSDPEAKYNQQLLLNIIHWLDPMTE